MLIWTYKKIEIGEELEFYGESDDSNPPKFVSLWQDRSNNGLGHEMVYGSAIVLTKIGGLYIGRRIT